MPEDSIRVIFEHQSGAKLTLRFAYAELERLDFHKELGYYIDRVRREFIRADYPLSIGGKTLLSFKIDGSIPVYASGCTDVSFGPILN